MNEIVTRGQLKGIDYRIKHGFQGKTAIVLYMDNCGACKILKQNIEAARIPVYTMNMNLLNNQVIKDQLYSMIGVNSNFQISAFPMTFIIDGNHVSNVRGSVSSDIVANW